MSNAALAALVDHPRSDWTDQTRPRALTSVDHPCGEVHHTAVARHADMDPADVLREVEDYHLGLGWNGGFYGVLLARDGELWELRGVGWRSIGRYRPTYDDGTPVDPRALCIVLPGDYGQTSLTTAQQATLQRLRIALPDDRLRWHGQRAETACCGARAIARIDTLNQTPPEDDMAASPPIVAGHDGENRWWRAVTGGDMVEVTEADARALVEVTPGSRIVSHTDIIWLKRCNAPINLRGEIER
ncbi:MAG: hypothetical protein U5R31_02985 [Acidimicrobiia bacterium]|nr:hypothetical protein [Acidimicrobiia bacterium]